MNLQTSTSYLYNDRRQLFAYELMTGGHGQIPLTGAGTYTPTDSTYVFYKIDFFTPGVISNIGFRNSNASGDTIYHVTSTGYPSLSFPGGYTWYVPVTSVTVTSGTGIAYEYKLFDMNDCCPNVLL